MTWPSTDVPTTNADAGTDNPQVWRENGLDLTNKFNQLRSHVTTFMQGLLAAADAPAARATLQAAAIESGTAYPVGCLVFAFQANTLSAIAAYGGTNVGANLYPAGVLPGTEGLFIRAGAIGIGEWRCIGMGGNAGGGGNGTTLASIWQRIS